MSKTFIILATGLAVSLLLCRCSSFRQQTFDPLVGQRTISIPTIDLSGMEDHQIVITPNPMQRQGHANSILMPDGKTMYVIWTIGHAGPCGQLKRSDDAGLTWSEMLPVPDNWTSYRNCPPLYLLRDQQGKERLTTYVNRTPYGMKMARSYSEDGGATWTPFEPVMCADGKDTLVADVMPFTSIVPIEDGKRLLGVSNMRRPYYPKNFSLGRTNMVVQSYSDDGGATWTRWRTILELDAENIPCEPEIIRSPDGKELLMIIRDNNRDFNSWVMTSRNEGKTWDGLRQLPASVTMDRHKACWLPDGRLIIVGRDVAANSPCLNHFVAWIGTYDDLANCREGQYRIKMLHTFKTTEYPGLSVLDDGTVVAITTLQYREDETYSVVESRFNIAETDLMYKKKKNFLK